MAKKAYIGVGGVARKVKNIYVGVGGVARKIKKAYIGVGGVARPFWGGGELAYYGTATNLNSGAERLAATTVGDYALFGGGIIRNVDIYSGAPVNRTAVMTAYNASLTKSTPTALSEARGYLVATSVGDYALFGGGIYGVDGLGLDKATATVDAYSKSLTRSTPSSLNKEVYDNAATTVGDYALFGGGRTTGYCYSIMTAYSRSLTQTRPAKSNAYGEMAATTVGDYALFGGGETAQNGGSLSARTTAYNASLTKSTTTDLSVARKKFAATTVGDYALFGGGSKKNTVDAYNKSLTRSIPTALSATIVYNAATTVGDYALFGGGNLNDNYSGRTNVVDAYDTSLTKSTPTALSVSRGYLAATTVGNYALFGGGHWKDQDNWIAYSYSTVDVYTVA